jgi:hypothetical protein
MKPPQSPSRQQWTPKDDERLKAMIIAGWAPREIAIRLMRSIAAVYARASLFGLSFKRVKARK